MNKQFLYFNKIHTTAINEKNTKKQNTKAL